MRNEISSRWRKILKKKKKKNRKRTNHRTDSNTNAVNLNRHCLAISYFRKKKNPPRIESKVGETEITESHVSFRIRLLLLLSQFYRCFLEFQISPLPHLSCPITNTFCNFRIGAILASPYRDEGKSRGWGEDGETKERGKYKNLRSFGKHGRSSERVWRMREK